MLYELLSTSCHLEIIKKWLADDNKEIGASKSKKVLKHTRHASSLSSPLHQAITTRLAQKRRTVKASRLEGWGIHNPYGTTIGLFVKEV
jgi:hypothetical protein